MKAGVLFFVIRDATNYLVAKGLLKTDGTCLFNNLQDDLGLALVIETSLREHGVDVPDQVDKIIKALPLIVSMFG